MTIIVHSRGGSWSKLGKVFSILFNAPFNLVFIISGVSDHSDAEYLLSTVTKSCHKLETLKVIHCSKLSDDCISSLVESKVAHSLKVSKSQKQFFLKLHCPIRDIKILKDFCPSL